MKYTKSTIILRKILKNSVFFIKKFAFFLGNLQKSVDILLFLYYNIICKLKERRKNMLEQKVRNDIKKIIEQDEKSLKDKMENISSSYMLAKLDFITIDNLKDSIETYNKVLLELEDLLQRRISRNNTKVI